MVGDSDSQESQTPAAEVEPLSQIKETGADRKDEADEEKEDEADENKETGADKGNQERGLFLLAPLPQQ